MADVLVKPAFQSVISDTGDATRLGPTEWNKPRLFTGGANGDVCVRDSTSATGAAWTTTLPTLNFTSIYAASTGSVKAIQGVMNGSATAVEGIVNSGSGIGVAGYSVSTSQPAAVGGSTGYYGGSFYNITDQGSNALNARAIGLVGQSGYSNAIYAQQGDVGAVLSRDNVLPALYVTRVTAGLNGHDFTLPLLTVEDTTAATGGLFKCIRGGSTKFSIDTTGIANALTALSVGATPATVGAVRLPNAGLITARNAANAANLQIATLWSDNILYLGDTGVDVLPWSGAQILGSAALPWANLFSARLVNIGYYEGTEMTAPAAGAVNTGRLYFDDNGAGKTRLMCIFNTGAAQQVAIQP